jgi:hypothetical protein
MSQLSCELKSRLHYEMACAPHIDTLLQSFHSSGIPEYNGRYIMNIVYQSRTHFARANTEDELTVTYAGPVHVH